MKPLLIILIFILSFQSYAQIRTSKQIELKKARILVSATVIPTLVSGAVGMYMLTLNNRDVRATSAIPLVNMTFFFCVSVKAINEKNKIKRL